jgi:hypothetical protein
VFKTLGPLAEAITKELACRAAILDGYRKTTASKLTVIAARGKLGHGFHHSRR